MNWRSIGTAINSTLFSTFLFINSCIFYVKVLFHDSDFTLLFAMYLSRRPPRLGYYPTGESINIQIQIQIQTSGAFILAATSRFVHVTQASSRRASQNFRQPLAYNMHNPDGPGTEIFSPKITFGEESREWMLFRLFESPPRMGKADQD